MTRSERFLIAGLRAALRWPYNSVMLEHIEHGVPKNGKYAKEYIADISAMRVAIREASHCEAMAKRKPCRIARTGRVSATCENCCGSGFAPPSGEEEGK